jgi:tRNA pseudouridine55 synthase
MTGAHDVHGVLVVDKPKGPTSHDVVAQARRLLRTRAVGHAGTLDPMATGVLVLLVGEATKLAAYLSLDDKEYRATIAFGRSTDTLDAEGRTTVEAALPPGGIEAAALDRALATELARTEQIPPAFSAVSVDGQRAHRLARRGKTVELDARPIRVRAMTAVERTADGVTVDLSVTKGYYVRSFARDLGEAVGFPAHLSALRRRRSGPYGIEDAVPWPPGDSTPPLLPLAEAAARAMPLVELTAEGAVRAWHGKLLGPEHFREPPPPGRVSAWVRGERELLALGRDEEGGSYRVLRGFHHGPEPFDTTENSIETDQPA